MFIQSGYSKGLNISAAKTDKPKRRLQLSSLLQKGQRTMNHDGGNYILPYIYDQLLIKRSPSTDKSYRTDRKLGHKPEEVLRRNMKL